MPARNRSKNPPAAPQRKRMLHALYLAQPFLQFFALMAVLFVLGRCSPLSPSTEKSRLKSTSENGVIATPSENGENLAIEEHFKEVPSTELVPVLSQTEFREYVRESLYGDKRSDQGRVKFIFQQRSREVRRSTRVLSISLTPQERAEFKQGSTRIQLSERLKATMDADTLKLFLSLLRNPRKNIQGKLVLVHADQSAESNAEPLPLHTRLRLAVLPGDERAFLQLSQVEERIDDAQRELIRSNLDSALELAVVLE